MRSGQATGRFVRVESTTPDANGEHPGVFTLLRVLRGSGRLSDADAVLAGQLVARAYALHDEPPAEAYTSAGSRSWFRAATGDVAAPDVSTVAAAAALTELSTEICSMLARYGVRTRVRMTDDPGSITYTDRVQVVAHRAPAASSTIQPLGSATSDRSGRGVRAGAGTSATSSTTPVGAAPGEAGDGT